MCLGIHPHKMVLLVEVGPEIRVSRSGDRPPPNAFAIHIEGPCLLKLLHELMSIHLLNPRDTDP